MLRSSLGIQQNYLNIIQLDVIIILESERYRCKLIHSDCIVVQLLAVIW